MLQGKSAAVGYSTSFTVQNLSDCQSRLFWPVKEFSHNVSLAPLKFHESAKMKPTVQETVALVTYVLYAIESYQTFYRGSKVH
jgi:hypothetical protein